jgi:hypothetical protein
MIANLFVLWIGCALSYKLGAYNQRHPGRMLELLRQGWGWMNV